MTNSNNNQLQRVADQLSELQHAFMDSLMVLKAAHQLMPEDAGNGSPRYLVGLSHRQLNDVYDQLDHLELQIHRAIKEESTINQSER